MVQLRATFEKARVCADMAFCDIFDSSSDTAVPNGQPNGQWWLFDWYAGLTGDAVAVPAPPTPAPASAGSGAPESC